jgi:integrase
MSLTRTTSTEADYMTRAQQLVASLRRQLGATDGHDVLPSDIVRYLDQRSADIVHASWRQYKASLLAYVHYRAETDEGWRKAVTDIEAMRWSSARLAPEDNHTLRTSARKDKNPTDERLKCLHDWLALHNAEAEAFFVATIRTGLRPKEWCAAELKYCGCRTVLVVKNAKATNGRAHGVDRKLWFEILSFQQDRAIRTTITMFAEASKANDYDALLERMQRTFSVAVSSLWPQRKRRITPYSLRHAFAARIKLLYPPEEVAALMGHGVDETAFKHYGRRNKKSARGWSLSLPKADPNDVARVKRKYAISLAALAKTKVQAHADTATEPTENNEIDDRPTLKP